MQTVLYNKNNNTGVQKPRKPESPVFLQISYGLRKTWPNGNPIVIRIQ